MSRARIAVIAGFAVALASGCGDDVLRPESPYRNSPLVPDPPVSVPLGEPDLNIDDMSISDSAFGDGDGLIEQGEVVEVTLTVSNIGNGKAVDGVIRTAWTGDSGSRFQWVVDSAAVGTLAPGKSVQLPPLSFLVTSAATYAIGTYDVRYDESRYSEMVDSMSVTANAWDYTQLLATGHPTWNLARDDQYLAYIDRVSFEYVRVADLVNGGITDIDGGGPGNYRMSMANGRLAYTWERPSGGVGTLATVRIADAATGVVTDVADGYDTEINPWCRPAISDNYLVWMSNSASVQIGYNEDPAPAGVAMRIMDLNTGGHRQLSTAGGAAEWSPVIDGNLVAYVSDYNARLQNLDDGTDVLLASGVWDVGLANGRMVWTYLNNTMVIHELATGNQISVQLPASVTSEVQTISVGNDWAAVATDDYFGARYLFLVRLSDGVVGPLNMEYPYDNATIYQDKLLFTWVSAIRQSDLPQVGTMW